MILHVSLLALQRTRELARLKIRQKTQPLSKMLGDDNRQIALLDQALDNPVDPVPAHQDALARAS